jgi:hypothetical protein
MATFRITLTDPGKTGGILKAALEGFARPIASAATAAIIQAGDASKLEGRAKIASEGFSSKWVNSFRVKYYPDGLKKPSISAAAFIYHKIPYAGVFDEPTQIVGNPLLWLPITGAMQSKGRPLTPKQLSAKGVKLFSMVGHDVPLLGAKIKTSKRAAASGSIKPQSLSSLKRGTGGKRGVEATVALFKGIPAVQLKKAFNIGSVVAKQAASVQSYYSAALKPDGG